MWLLFASMERITTELQPNKNRIRTELQHEERGTGNTLSYTEKTLQVGMIILHERYSVCNNTE